MFVDNNKKYIEFLEKGDITVSIINSSELHLVETFYDLLVDLLIVEVVVAVDRSFETICYCYYFLFLITFVLDNFLGLEPVDSLSLFLPVVLLTSKELEILFLESPSGLETP